MPPPQPASRTSRFPEPDRAKTRTMASSAGSEDGDIGFQIAPMVDVVFVLMLFFMASAGSQIIEKELNISLPTNERGTESLILIEISPEGQVTMNNQPFGTPSDQKL